MEKERIVNVVGEVVGGKPNGQGTYTFSPQSKFAGDTYIGEVKNGKPNGQGLYTYANGKKYVGEFRDGLKTGKGKFTYENLAEFAGDTYVGEVMDGEPNGQGTYTWGPSSEFAGDFYVGEWRNGERFNGGYTFGSISTSSPYLEFGGTFKNDKMWDGEIETLSKYDGIIRTVGYYKKGQLWIYNNFRDFDTRSLKYQPGK